MDKAIVDSVVKDICALWPVVEVRVDGPTRGGIWFIDIRRNGQLAVLEVRDGMPAYGLSLIDDDTGYGEGADCLFGHLPTMLKYLKRLLP